MPERLPFFEQLAAFSRRVLAELGLDPEGSPNGAGGFGPRHDQLPTGIVLHYTATPSLAGTARWLGGAGSDSSCHAVIADERLPWTDALCEDLPLVEELPATVVQLRPPERGAWHATWANEWALGIELCSIGRIKPDGEGGWRSWEDDWAKAYAPRRRVVRNGDVCFEAYSDAQVDACERLCGWYGCQVDAWGGALDPAHLLGHEQVQGTYTHGSGGHDKRDPGPLDLDAMRWAAHNRGPGSDIDHKFDRPADPVRQGDLALPLDFAAVRRLLDALGYETGRVPRAEWMADPTVVSARIFQRMMGLAADGVCGPLTQQALIDRYVDRRTGN